MDDPRVAAAVIAALISLLGIIGSYFITRLQIRVKLLEIELKLAAKGSATVVQAAFPSRRPRSVPP